MAGPMTAACFFEKLTGILSADESTDLNSSNDVIEFHPRSVAMACFSSTPALANVTSTRSIAPA